MSDSLSAKGDGEVQRLILGSKGSSMRMKVRMRTRIRVRMRMRMNIHISKT